MKVARQVIRETMQLQFVLITITVLSEAKKNWHGHNHSITLSMDEMPKQRLLLIETYKKHDKYEDIKKTSLMENFQTNLEPRSISYPNLKAPVSTRKPVEVTETKNITKRKTDSKQDDTLWLDFTRNYFRNIGRTRHRTSIRNNAQKISKKAKSFNKLPLENAFNNMREHLFPRNYFESEFYRSQNMNYNSTTCNEFGHNAYFHPNYVVDIDWVPFFTWSQIGVMRPVAVIHTFSFPTVKLVQKYKTEMGPLLNKSVDWDESTLYLKSDLSMLLVAIDRKGEFDGIPYTNMPSSVKNAKIWLPTLHLRLKIVGQYLAMMFCERQYATIMAVSGHEPTTIKKIRSEAAKLKFKGRGYPVVRNREIEKTARMVHVDPNFLF